MTVLKGKKPYPAYNVPRYGNAYPGIRPVQDRITGFDSHTRSRRSADARRSAALPAFSSEGVRWDVWIVTIALMLLLFLCVLFADVEAVVDSGNRIGNLNAGIESLEESKVLIQDQLAIRLQHPVLTRMNDTAETGEVTVITLSAAPLS